MKKLLTLAIALILTSALVLPVSAADADYDETELKQLLTDAFEIYIDFFREFYDFASTPVKLFDFDDFVLEGNSQLYEDHLKYAKVGGQYEKWDDFVAILESHYTEYLCEKFIYESNVYNMEGYTYLPMSKTGAQNQGVWFEPDAMVAEGYDFNLDSTFKITEVKGNKITAEFWVCYFDENPVRTETVEYTYTNEGWRISGGSFFTNNIDSYYHFKDATAPATAPATALTTAVYAAVAALALGVVVVKKKR